MRIAVLEKSFAVLEAMSGLDRAASLKDVGDLTGLPKPTLYRILQTLSELGYVGQDRARSRYRLTPRLLWLAQSTSQDEVRERALPLMEALHKRFNETVNLGVLQGREVHYVHVIDTTQNLRWQVRPGGSDPFHSTALGRAIVAELPDARRAELVGRVKFEQRTPFTVAGPAELARILDETRVRGIAIDDEENDLGVVCLGVPFINKAGAAAAISVSVPKGRMTPALFAAIEGALLRLRGGRRPPTARQRTAGEARPA
jgi:DNA-binding IclR family transcriptional regulator